MSKSTRRRFVLWLVWGLVLARAPVAVGAEETMQAELAPGLSVVPREPTDGCLVPRPIVPTGNRGESAWRLTTQTPPTEWYQPGFDDTRRLQTPPTEWYQPGFDDTRRLMNMGSIEKGMRDEGCMS